MIGPYLLQKPRAPCDGRGLGSGADLQPAVLDRCLAGLVAQAFDPSAYEIVIADDAASDRTCRQVEEWRSRCLRRRDRPSTTCRCGHARSGRRPQCRVAIRPGRVIAFTDDDCIPEPEWLAAGTRAIRDGATGVSGRVVVPPTRGPTDYERNAAGWRPRSSSPRTASISGRRSRLSAGSTSVSPWPGGRIAISG